MAYEEQLKTGSIEKLRSPWFENVKFKCQLHESSQSILSKAFLFASLRCVIIDDDDNVDDDKPNVCVFVSRASKMIAIHSLESQSKKTHEQAKEKKKKKIDEPLYLF